MHQNEGKYDTLLHSSADRAWKSTFKNLDLQHDDCRIINNFSVKICVMWLGFFTVISFYFFEPLGAKK